MVATAMTVEAKIRAKRQRFAAVLVTNCGRKYSVNYVDQHGMYHRERGDLNMPNAKKELARRQAQYPGRAFEILPEEAL